LSQGGNIITHMRELLKNGSHLLYRKQTNILSAAFIIMSTYALSHIMGLFKTRLLISYFFGSRAALLDVYYAAFVIPDSLFQLLVIGSLSAAFIPVFTRYLARREEEAWTMASSAMNLVLLVFTVISAFIFIFAAPLSRLIAPGFDPVQIEIMASLLRVMLAAQLFFSVSGFLTGMIQSHQRFLIPALAPVAYNLGIILGIVFLSSPLGIYGPAVGVVLGASLHMLVQLPLALRLGFRFIPSINFRHSGVRETMRLMPPRALALGIDQVEQFAAVILASLLVPGSLTILNVARLLYAIPASLFGVTLGQAALPTLSRQSAEADRKTFISTLTETLLQSVFLALPVTILFIVLRIPIVRLVFGARSFPWLATLTTGKTLAILAFSAISSTLLQLIIRAFYALHDTRTPLVVGFFAALFDVSLSVVFVKVFNWNVLGLAAAISLTTFVETLVLFVILSSRLSPDNRLFFAASRPFSKMAVVALVMGISLWIPMRLLDRFVFDTTRTLPLLALTAITSSIGLGVYLFLSYLFQVRELSAFLSLARRLYQWPKFFAGPEPSEPLIIPASDQN